MEVLAHTVLDARDAGAARDGEPTRVWLLHGILGSGRNWRSFARRMQSKRPDLQVVLVDLRAHGDSGHMSPPHTLSACVQDIVSLADLLGYPDVLCGHSFGGKVALLAGAAADGAIAQAWSLDSPPGLGPTVPGEIDAVISALRRFEMPVQRREEVRDGLVSLGFSDMLANWMTTNLVRRPPATGLFWRFDLDAIEALLQSYFETDVWPVLEGSALPFARRVLRAARSSRFSREDTVRLDAASHSSNVSSEVLADAGHWLHVDNPAGLLQWCLRWLPVPKQL